MPGYTAHYALQGNPTAVASGSVPLPALRAPSGGTAPEAIAAGVDIAAILRLCRLQLAV